VRYDVYIYIYMSLGVRGLILSSHVHLRVPGNHCHVLGPKGRIFDSLLLLVQIYPTRP
jgi:hypothetical protein